MKLWHLKNNNPFENQCIMCGLPTDTFIRFNNGIIFIHPSCQELSSMKIEVTIDFGLQHINIKRIT